MSRQMTLFDTDNVTGSQELQDGLSPCDLLGASISNHSGPEVARVARSRRQVNGGGMVTLGTCGHLGFGLSGLHDRCLFLASRYLRQLSLVGATDCSTTWSRKATSGGRVYLEHIPLEHRMKDSDCIGRLPTPQTMDSKGYSDALRHKFRKTGHLKHWLHGTQLAVHSATGVSSWPNPMFAEWMMGFPRLWISGHDYTPTATP